MPFPFNVIQRVNPQDPAAPRKFYAQARANGDVDLKHLARQIARESSLSTGDITSVLKMLVEIIPQYLAEGRIVRLADLGSFRLTLHSEGSDTEDAVNASNIKSQRLRFRPGREVMKLLTSLEYRKVSNGNGEA